MKAKTPVCMETVWFCPPEAAVKCIFRFSFKAFASSYKVGHSLGLDDPVMILWGWNNLEKVIRAEELRGTVAKKRLLDSQGTVWCSESEFAASRCERMCLEEDWAMEGNIFDHAKDFSDSRNEDVHSDIGQSSCHSVKLVFTSILSRRKPARTQSRSCLYWDSPASRPSKSTFGQTGDQQHITPWGFKEIAWGSGCKSPASANLLILGSLLLAVYCYTSVSTIIVLVNHHDRPHHHQYNHHDQHNILVTSRSVTCGRGSSARSCGAELGSRTDL